jgi:hypothetical protein
MYPKRRVRTWFGSGFALGGAPGISLKERKSASRTLSTAKSPEGKERTVRSVRVFCKGRCVFGEPYLTSSVVSTCREPYLRSELFCPGSARPAPPVHGRISTQRGGTSGLIPEVILDCARALNVAHLPRHHRAPRVTARSHLPLSLHGALGGGASKQGRATLRTTRRWQRLAHRTSTAGRGSSRSNLTIYLTCEAEGVDESERVSQLGRSCFCNDACPQLGRERGGAE